LGLKEEEVILIWGLPFKTGHFNLGLNRVMTFLSGYDGDISIWSPQVLMAPARRVGGQLE
jgi:hypothetical protein